jgi:molybdenum hydroxylase accessory protein, YgfJ family
MINAIIMASGYGRRMGKDKLLLPFRDKLLVEHIIEKVMGCDFYNRVIVSRDERILSLAAKKGIKGIENDNAYKGQSESIKLGIINTLEAHGYMFFTADQPLIHIETIKLLMHTFNKNSNCIIVPRFGEKRGNPVIFPVKFVNELMLIDGDKGGKSVINNHIKDVIFVDIKNEYELMDIDTYEDYEKILNIKE